MSMDSLLQWLAGVSWELYLLAGGVSVIVALAEVVTVFEADPVSALRTWGAAFLLFLNGIMAVLVLALLRTLFPETRSPLVALAVGLGLPTLVRTRFTILKPLPGTTTSEGIDIRLDELYERLQRFCRGRIDVALASRRVRLVSRALERLALDKLEQQARLLLEGGLTLVPSDKGREYVDKIMNQESYDERRKKMLLAFAILNYGGQAMLAEMLREKKR